MTLPGASFCCYFYIITVVVFNLLGRCSDSLVDVRFLVLDRHLFQFHYQTKFILFYSFMYYKPINCNFP